MPQQGNILEMKCPISPAVSSFLLPWPTSVRWYISRQRVDTPLSLKNKRNQIEVTRITRGRTQVLYYQLNRSAQPYSSHNRLGVKDFSTRREYTKKEGSRRHQFSVVTRVQQQQSFRSHFIYCTPTSLPQFHVRCLVPAIYFECFFNSAKNERCVRAVFIAQIVNGV